MPAMAPTMNRPRKARLLPWRPRHVLSQSHHAPGSRIPDTNIWRYLVDAGAVELLRRSAQATGVEVVACPAVVYECLRVRDAALRGSLELQPHLQASNR